MLAFEYAARIDLSQNRPRARLFSSLGSTAASHTLIANGGNSIGDDLVDLIGARLITVSETEEGQSLAEAKIKQMTGGDRLKGRPLYGTHIQFNRHCQNKPPRPTGC